MTDQWFTLGFQTLHSSLGRWVTACKTAASPFNQLKPSRFTVSPSDSHSIPISAQQSLQQMQKKKRLNRIAISRTRRGRADNNLASFFCFFPGQTFGPPASVKEVFSPEETVCHVKQQDGHLGGGISSASCDRSRNYNRDPSGQARLQSRTSAKCRGRKSLGKADVRVK